jgi:hypothetical protein
MQINLLQDVVALCAENKPFRHCCKIQSAPPAGFTLPPKNPQPSFSAKSEKQAKRTRRSAPPTKPKNADMRKREYLTPDEVTSLKRGG